MARKRAEFDARAVPTPTVTVTADDVEVEVRAQSRGRRWPLVMGFAAAAALVGALALSGGEADRLRRDNDPTRSPAAKRPRRRLGRRMSSRVTPIVNVDEPPRAVAPETPLPTGVTIETIEAPQPEVVGGPTLPPRPTSSARSIASARAVRAGASLRNSDRVCACGRSARRSCEVGTDENAKVRWNDVAGYESAKARLDDVLGHVLHRAALAERGLPLSAGLLLEGLPGCGKTIMAHAMAGPSGLVVTPGQIRGASPELSIANLRAVFEQVRHAGPSALVLDDLDLLVGTGVADECARRLSAELRVLLEFAPVSGVFVIGCVRLAAALPPGLRRSGRFDHHVSLMPPTPGDRRAILQHHVAAHPGLELGDDVDLHTVAAATPLMTGADLASIVREASRRALDPSRDRIVIGQDHLLTAASHQRRSLTVVGVQRWLDAVRAFPGNDNGALALEQDIESFKTGRGELEAMDSADLLPSQSQIGAPIPRDDDLDARRTTMVSTEPDPAWDPVPKVVRRSRSSTQVVPQQPDPAWDPAPSSDTEED
ncbi:MAG: ATP-binding protein [Myxococcota bacterium]